MNGFSPLSPMCHFITNNWFNAHKEPCGDRQFSVSVSVSEWFSVSVYSGFFLVTVSVSTEPKFRYFGFGFNYGFGRSLPTRNHAVIAFPSRDSISFLHPHHHLHQSKQTFLFVVCNKQRKWGKSQLELTNINGFFYFKM